MEAIVGDIPEQGDDDYEMIRREDGSYLVDARLPFYDFLSRFDKEDWMDDDQEFDTVGGFIIHHLERIPATGDLFELTFMAMPWIGPAANVVFWSIIAGGLLYWLREMSKHEEQQN